MSNQLAFDEADKRTDRRESRSVDLIILDDEAEPLFQHVEQANHCHRIELRDRAQQRRIHVEVRSAASQAQHFVDDVQHFLLDIQSDTPGCLRDRDGCNNLPMSRCYYMRPNPSAA